MRVWSPRLEVNRAKHKAPRTVGSQNLTPLVDEAVSFFGWTGGKPDQVLFDVAFSV